MGGSVKKLVCFCVGSFFYQKFDKARNFAFVSLCYRRSGKEIC